MNGSLTAVLFDADGTLVDTNYLHVVCWWEAFGQAGFDVPMGAGAGYDGPADLLASRPDSILGPAPRPVNRGTVTR